MAVVAQLEGAHMAAAEELEMLYEKRLQLQAGQAAAAQAASDDLRFKLEEHVVRLKEAHRKELRDVHALYEQKLKAADDRLQAAHSSKATAEFLHNEFINQTEDDFEDHTDRMHSRISKMESDTTERETALKSSQNMLKRDNYRLHCEKAADQKKVDSMASEVSAVRATCELLEAVQAKLSGELVERDAVINDNWHTIQDLRRRGQDLEKHKFVLGSKVGAVLGSKVGAVLGSKVGAVLGSKVGAVLGSKVGAVLGSKVGAVLGSKVGAVLGSKADTWLSQLGPKDAEIAALKAQQEAVNKELVTLMARWSEMCRQGAEKDTNVRGLKVEVSDLTAKMRQLQLMCASFSGDLFQAMAASDERTASGKSERQKALRKLCTKYCHGTAGLAKSNAEVEAEMSRQRALAEMRGEVLQLRLTEERKHAASATHASLHQNSQLLRELQVSQTEAREMARKHEAAVSQLRELSSRYNLLSQRVAKQSQQPDLRMHTTLPADSQDQGIVSMAGRVPPSRPTTALAANRTPPTYPASPQSAAASPYNPTTPTSSSASAGAGTNGGGATAAAAGGSSGSSRPGSAKLWPTGRGRDPLLRERPASAGFGMYRSSGGTPAQGVLAKGSPTRIMNELIHVERERIGQLMTVLQQQTQQQTQQAAHLSTLHDTLASALAATASQQPREQGGAATAATAATAAAAAAVQQQGSDPEAGESGRWQRGTTAATWVERRTGSSSNIDHDGTQGKAQSNPESPRGSHSSHQQQHNNAASTDVAGTAFRLAGMLGTGSGRGSGDGGAIQTVRESDEDSGGVDSDRSNHRTGEDGVGLGGRGSAGKLGTASATSGPPTGWGEGGEVGSSGGSIGSYALGAAGSLATALKRHGGAEVPLPRPTSAVAMLRATSVGRRGGQTGQASNVSNPNTPRRRPTSAAGVGMRAFINSSLETWRTNN
ncbi:MAG: hypothetical protein WDW38_000959 [Sanguina aurantia]